jgi:predicted nicotinamide N-methyase
MSLDADTLKQSLDQRLKRMLPDARLCWQTLPQCPSLGLWLLDPLPLKRPFSPQEVESIETYPAYWAFCWASGQWLSRYLLAHPSLVKGRSVLDFGAGSGVAGIAAAMAGARRVLACDIDPDAMDASRLNFMGNALSQHFHSHGNVFTLDEHFDVVLAADVLYDRSNLPLLDHLLQRGNEVWVADSRIRNFSHPAFERVEIADSFTFPDLDESTEFRRVTLYRGQLGKS